MSIQVMRLIACRPIPFQERMVGLTMADESMSKEAPISSTTKTFSPAPSRTHQRPPTPLPNPALQFAFYLAKCDYLYCHPGHWLLNLSRDVFRSGYSSTKDFSKPIIEPEIILWSNSFKRSIRWSTRKGRYSVVNTPK